MQLTISDNGYTIRVSARETEEWATRPGEYWPCSTLRGHRFMAYVDSNGLCEFTIDGRYDDRGRVDGHELNAIVADLTRGTGAAKFWPRWEF